MGELDNTPAISSYGPVVSTNVGLFAFNKNGTPRWNLPRSSRAGNNYSPTIGNDDLVYWQNLDTLLIVDDGVIIAKYEFSQTDIGYQPPR